MKAEDKSYIVLKYGIPVAGFSDDMNAFGRTMNALPEDFLIQYRYKVKLGMLLTGNRFHQRFTEPLYTICLLDDLLEYDQRNE